MYKGYQDEEELDEVLGKYRPIKLYKSDKDQRGPKDRRNRYDWDDDCA